MANAGRWRNVWTKVDIAAPSAETIGALVTLDYLCG